MTQVIPITQNRSKNKSGDFHKQEIKFDIKDFKTHVMKF